MRSTVQANPASLNKLLRIVFIFIIFLAAKALIQIFRKPAGLSKVERTYTAASGAALDGGTIASFSPRLFPHEQSNARKMLLVPNPYKIAKVFRRQSKMYLMVFYGLDCVHCQNMEPLMKQVENELGTKFYKLEVWYNPQNYRLLQMLDMDTKCEGLPFFYNARTHKHICGATTYNNLLAWAKGEESKSVFPPPLEAAEAEATNRKTGFGARIQKKILQWRASGEDRMRQRLEKEMNKHKNQN